MNILQFHEEIILKLGYFYTIVEKRQYIIYSQRQKSIDGYLIRMKWPYFQSLKNIGSTARKALTLFWLNAQDSEVVKKGLSCSSSTYRPYAKSSQSDEEFVVFS